MTVAFRKATEDDIAQIVALLRDDALGRTRELKGMQTYVEAFRDMAHEPHNDVFVGVKGGKVVATYQLTLLSGVSLGAARRAQIEAVRVASDLRGQGIGKALMQDAEARARSAKASLMQLTTNKTRSESHAFYRQNGFEPTHVGFKKPL